MTQTQLPPHDEAAEWQLLACTVVKPSIIPGINPELFYVTAAKGAYTVIAGAFDRNMACIGDQVTFEHFLSRSLDPDQYDALSKALNSSPSVENWIFWADTLADCFKARKLEQLKPKISEIAAKVAKGYSPDEILNEISEIAHCWQARRLESMRSLMPRVLETVEYVIANGRFPGPRTGFRAFDLLTGGLQHGRLHIVAGRPGQGKSSYAMALAIGAARNGAKVGFFSLEMSKEEIGLRMLAYDSRLPIYRINANNQHPDETRAVAEANLRIRQLAIGFEDKVADLSALIMAAHQSVAEGAELLIIDYLQKISIQKFRHNRNELVTEISGKMKGLAMALRVPVICCAQLNRASEREDREPTMADLRDSGSVEQDADFIGILHKITYNRTDMVVVKNRSGDTGKIALEFRRELFRFDECGSADASQAALPYRDA